ncbi:hypothetical protein LMG19083_01395 [Ralstonia psammae]|uniref:Uncharacterized protein n=1 Tax=Ralstonia psammae TaxID=3058598 RepID=A0ABN9IL04_9RALS|nr:hypothetical protein LMG19083_01395 [Ralstonia sp. LMG 19083]
MGMDVRRLPAQPWCCVDTAHGRTTVSAKVLVIQWSAVVVLLRLSCACTAMRTAAFAAP